ncbi:MAG: hypothetical protein ACYST3_05265 [Planctomycetota bacterium]|jgi:hypothetical protein
MKLLKKVSLVFCVLLLFSISATAQAVEGVSVNHRFMMADDLVEGGSIATLEVTVTNSGTSSLSEVLLVQNAPLELSDPLMQALHVNDLAADSESKLFWELSSSMSADQVLPLLTGFVSLNLLGVDDFGQNISLDITSEGGAE